MTGIQPQPQELQQAIGLFREHFFEPATGTFDPEGVHHEFNQGLHGRKVDFDAVLEGTDLYDRWVDVTVAAIAQRYSQKLLGNSVLIGVANGTNRLARDVATSLDCDVAALDTVKLGKGIINLTPESVSMLQEINPEMAVITEDIATRGTNGASVVLSTRHNAPKRLKRIEVINTLERSIPERLDELDVVYHSLIVAHMIDYEPERCAAEGYCADGWELIPYGH